jgi:hypothetical protein
LEARTGLDLHGTKLSPDARDQQACTINDGSSDYPVK